MRSDEGDDAGKSGWRLIPGGQKRKKASEEENEILNELRHFLAKAHEASKEFTFLITSRSITTRETVTAGTQEEAEKTLREKYPDATIERVIPK